MAEAIAWIGAKLMFSGAAEALGAFLLGNAAAVATGAMLVGGLAMSAHAKRKARAAYNAAQVDRLVNVRATVMERHLPLGRVRKGGSVIFAGSTGENKTTLIMLIALAEGEIDAVEQVWFNDEPVTLDEAGNVTTAPYMRTDRISRTEQFSGTASSVSHVLAYTPVADSVTVTFGAGSEDSGTSVPFTLSGSTVTVAGDPGGGTFTVNYQSAHDNSYAKITVRLGAPGQTASARVIELFPDEWTSAHTLSGVPYLECEFQYNESAFPNGLPVVTATIRGAKVYDPRTGTTAWTENPAILQRHVLLHPKFGRRASLTADEEARIEAAADACDVSTVYTVGGVAQPARALYTAGVVVPFGTPASDVLDDLAQAMGGQWAYADGQFFTRAGAYTAPVLSLDETDLAVVQRSIVGGAAQGAQQVPIRISTHRPRDQQINSVTATIWDAAQDYKQTALSALKSSALITADGAELNQSMTLSAVTYAPQALHIAGIALRDARDPLTITLPLKLTAFELELFDVFDLTLARYGWTAKPFQVQAITWAAAGTLLVTAKETAAAIYAMDADFTPQGYAENTSLPAPWDIEPPTITAVTSGTAEAIAQADGSVVPRVRVQWSAITDSSITSAGQVEVQWSLASDTPAWSSVIVAGAETQAFIVGAVAASSVILIRARTRNALAVSGWSVQQSHTVAGDLDPPPAVDAFWVLEQPGGVRQYLWEMASPPADLDGFLIRYTVGTSAVAWASMLPLTTATAAARSVEAAEPFGDDTYTFSIRAVDRSGNLGAIVSATAILDGGQYGTLDLLVLPHQESWPLGTRTNCTLVGTELVGAGAGSWSSWSGAWSDLTTWGSASSSSLTYEYPVIDRGSSAARRLTGSAVATGTAAVQYRSSADNVTWTAWASLPGSPVTARYYQFRWTVTDASPVLKRAQGVLYT